MMIEICYLFMNILQAMSLMFRYQTMLLSRKNEIMLLNQTGCDQHQILSSTGRKANDCFLLMLLYALIFPVNAGIALLHGHLIPLICIWVIIRLWYCRFVRNIIRVGKSV